MTNMLLSLCWYLIAGELRADIAKHVKAYSTGEPNVIQVTVNTPIVYTVLPVSISPVKKQCLVRIGEYKDEPNKSYNDFCGLYKI